VRHGGRALRTISHLSDSNCSGGFLVFENLRIAHMEMSNDHLSELTDIESTSLPYVLLAKKCF
jgi:hypothetical protein